jgi:IS5 family transposase
MREALRTLHSRVGRVMRDVERQVAPKGSGLADSGRVALQELIDRTKRILCNRPTADYRELTVQLVYAPCLFPSTVRNKLVVRTQQRG